MMTKVERLRLNGLIKKFENELLETVEQFEPTLNDEIDLDFPHIQAVLRGAERLTVNWSFDEQQADPIHQFWTWKKLRTELSNIYHLVKN